jgi:hypothetical protein
MWLEIHKMAVVFRTAYAHAMSVNDRIKSKIEYHIRNKSERFKLAYVCLSQESNNGREERVWEK